MTALSRFCVLLTLFLRVISTAELHRILMNLKLTINRPCGSGSIDHASLFGRQEELDSPLCIASCEMSTCGSFCSAGGILKRDLNNDLFHNTSGQHEDIRALGKRLFTYVPGSQSQNNYKSGKTGSLPTEWKVNAYIPAVYKGQEDVYYGDWLGTSVGTDERPVSQQILLGNNPFQILSPLMHGCTAIVLVSNKAVWMTHLWESYSNGKDDTGDNPTNAGDPAFNQRVLMFLRGEAVTNPLPNGYRDYVAPTGPGIDASLFNNRREHQTQLFIYTPLADDGAAKEIKYEARYGETGEVVQTIRDILGLRSKGIIVPYRRLDFDKAAEKAQLGTDARGAVLFQYDPDSDGKGKKAWRIFMENRFEMRDI